jgi:hypothetical protein
MRRLNGQQSARQGAGASLHGQHVIRLRLYEFFKKRLRII